MGDGLPQLAEDLGIADVVEFRPHSPRAELFRWYCVSDVVGVPSHNESFGLVALEAQACGRPVVATDVGGLRHAVEDGVTGLLVPGHDPDEWATGARLDPGRPGGLAVARGGRSGPRGDLQLVEHGRLDLARLRGSPTRVRPRRAPLRPAPEI